jgi:ribosome-associated translation inhibitor RaiA
MVVNGRVLDPADPTKVLATYPPQTIAGQDASASIPSTPIPADWKPGDLNLEALTKYSASAQRLAKQLVNYDITLPTGAAQSREPWVSAIQAAGELDPTWKASEYQSRLSARRSFTSGADAKNITGLNTAIGHLQTLLKAGEALKNHRVQMLNKLENWAAEKTGDPRIVRFNIAANAVQNELASVFKGTGATDQEINAWRRTIDASQSPEQITGAISQAVDLLGSRLATLRGKWEQAMGKPMDMTVLTSRSRETLNSMGINPDELEPRNIPLAGPGQPQPQAVPLGPASAPSRIKILKVE